MFVIVIVAVVCGGWWFCDVGRVVGRVVGTLTACLISYFSGEKDLLIELTVGLRLMGNAVVIDVLLGY